MEYIRIGCVKTKVPHPVLLTRTARIELWAFARADNWDPTIENLLRGCLVESALVGTVVGVVLANFAAALAAFQTAFEACIKSRLLQLVVCTLVGLLILKRRSAWNPV